MTQPQTDSKQPEDSQAHLHHLRKEYSLRALSEDQVDANPFVQFGAWFGEALAASLPEPNAMTLSTVGKDLVPSSRVVLLKSWDERGFVFFSNYSSRKGRQLAENPQAALLFYWPELERQIRIEGRAELTSSAESDAYFASRPVGSRLGAHVSPQSEVIPSREHLERELVAVEARFGAGEIPRPAHWGGYRIVPTRIEFWQGRPSRLHDRLVYSLSEPIKAQPAEALPAGWQLRRLAP